MAHPLVGKYGDTDLMALEPEDAVVARDEIKKALAGQGSHKLNSTDRIALLKIWMSAFESPETPTPAALPRRKNPAPARSRRLKPPAFQTLRKLLRALSILRFPDIAFLLLCLGVTVGVIMLGAHSMNESLRIEDVKREAEGVVAWIKENGGDKRADEGFQPPACSKSATEGWKGCLDALSAEGGPFSGKVNKFDRARPYFVAKCDMADPTTVGGIIIEKGAVPLGGSSIVYTAFDGSESMAKEMTLRVIVCGRGFHLIKVAIELSF